MPPNYQSSGKATSVPVSISSGTESVPFGIPGAIAFARISASTPALTLTLQRLGADGTSWVDTVLTHATEASESATTAWTSEDLAPYAGLFGRDNNLRLTLSSSDSINVVFDCRNSG